MEETVVDHSEIKSVDLLFKSFCNHLYLGQWYLAKSCVEELISTHNGKLDTDVRKTLLKIANNPYDVSLGSENIPTPHHLSWLCLKTHSYQEEEDSADDISSITSDVELRLLLYDCIQNCQDISHGLIKDIYQYYKAVLKVKGQHPEDQKSTRVSISQDVQNLIYQLMVTSPIHGCFLTHHLCFDNAQIPWLRDNTKSLELHHLHALTRTLKSLAAEDSDGTSHGLRSELRTKLYTLLSRFESVQVPDVSRIEFLRDLFVYISREDSLLDWGIVYSCLLGHESAGLLNSFLAVTNDLIYQSHVERSRASTALVADPLDDTGLFLLSISETRDRHTAWKDLLLYCQKKHRHFMDLIMETSVQLIVTGQISRLQMLLSPPEMAPLRPLVLLVGWDSCEDSTVAADLLTTLWNPQDSYTHEFIRESCRKLTYQVEMIEWCLSKIRALGCMTRNMSQMAYVLYRDLEIHSALYILRHATQLSSLDNTTVINLLNNSPVIDPVISGATCRDQLATLGHERDLVIFRGYSAVRIVMDAIIFSAETDTWDDPKKLKSCLPLPSSPTQDIPPETENDVDWSDQSKGSNERAFSRSISVQSGGTLEPAGKSRSVSLRSTDSSVIHEISAYKEAFQDLYTRNVADPLKEMRNLVSNIYPLSYRVEILENIFSLLFVSHEALADSGGPGDSGEEGGDEAGTWFANPDTPAMGSSVGESLTPSTPLSPMDSPFKPYSPFSGSRLTHTASSHGNPDRGTQGNKEKTKSQRNLFMMSDSRLYEVLEESLKVRTSGSVSNASNTSTGSSRRIGFLANKNIVRDLISVLKECMKDFDDSRTQLKGGERSNADPRIDFLEKELPSCLSQSVRSGQLSQRFSRLHKYIMETEWRSKLVLPSTVPEEFGKVTLPGIRDDITGSAEPVHANRFRKRKRIRTTSGQSITEDSSSESDAEVNSSADADGSQTASSTGECPRGPTPVFRSRSAGLKGRRSGIISRMLASRESLLVMSLRKGNFKQANAVIKIYGLEDSPVAREMIFARHYESAMKELERQSPVARHAGTGSKSGRGKSSKAKVSMSSIANKAAAGVASLSVKGNIEQILSLSELPQFPVELLTQIQMSSPALASHLDPHRIPAMIALDLGLVGSRSWDSALSLLETSQHRTGSNRGPTERSGGSWSHRKGTKDNCTPGYPGPTGLLEKALELLKLGRIEGLGENTQAAYRQSMTKYLTTAMRTLCVTSTRTLTSALTCLDREVKRVRRTLGERTRRKRESGGKDDVLTAFSGLLGESRKLLPSEGLPALILRVQKQTDIPTMSYLQNIFDHCKTLAYLKSQWLSASPDKSEYFQVLDESPTHIFGHLIFMQDAPAEEVEIIAKELNIDLVKVLTNSCCPNVRVRALNCTPVQQRCERNMRGKIVLNYVEGIHLSSAHPDVIVRKVLNNLKELLLGCQAGFGQHPPALLSSEVCKKVVLSRRHMSHLTFLHQLKDIDLTLLGTKEERWCFYVNLINTLIIHSALHIAEEQSMDEVETKEDSLSNLILENKMAYVVGQLGVVSLYDLKYEISRLDLPPPLKYKGAVAARHLELDSEDPWRKFGCFPDPRLSFVIIERPQPVLPVLVLYPDMVKHQLRVAAKCYLSKTVTVDIANQTAILPNILKEHQRDFVSSPDAASSEFSREAALLGYVAGQVGDETANEIRKLIDSSDNVSKKKKPTKTAGPAPQVVYIKPNSSNDKSGLSCGDLATPGSYFIKASSANVSLKRRNSLPGRVDTTKPSPLFRNRSHNLTPATLEYLTTRSDFVAMVTSLVAMETDPLSNLLDSDHFQVRTPVVERSLSELTSSMASSVTSEPGSTIRHRSAIDVQTYRKLKLKEYPAVETYLMTYILPIARATYPDVLRHSDVDSVLKLFEAPVSLDADLRICMLSPPWSQEFQGYIRQVAGRLVNTGQWDSLLSLLDACPTAAMHTTPDWTLLKNFCLCVLSSQHSLGTRSGDNSGYIRHISDPLLKVRATLGKVKQMDIGTGIKLFRQCMIQGDELGGNMESLVNKRFQEMQLYQKITEYARDLLTKLGRVGDTSSMITPLSTSVLATSLYKNLDWPLQLLKSLTHWQHVVLVSQENPDHVLEVILQSNAFEEAYEWAEIFEVSVDLVRCIDVAMVSHHLDLQPSEVTRAYTALESLYRSDPSVCLCVCYSVLEKPLKKSSLLYVIRFVLDHLQDKLDKHRIGTLTVWAMGCKAITNLPFHLIDDYQHLAEAPILLLEQLLMNNKIDLASKVLASLRSDFDKCDKDISPLSISLQSFDNLLEEYAGKALEFSVIAPQSPGSMMSSRLSLSSVGKPASQPTVQSPAGMHRALPSMPQISTTSPLLMASSSYQWSDSIQTIHRFGSRTGSRAKMAGSLPTAKSLPKRIVATPETTEQEVKKTFVMPAEPPTKDQWVPDSDASVCMVCQRERFSMFNRRHHCRRCGRVVCATCSSKTIVLAGTSVRACTDCHQQTYVKPRGANEEQEKIKRLRDRLSGLTTDRSSPSPAGIQITIGSPESDASGLSGEEHADLEGCDSKQQNCDYFYQLTLNMEHNDIVREDFYYDCAPSTALCLSILELHSQPDACAAMILSQCEKVSRYLQPVYPGVRNPEVDYAFVISMLKYLLFNAKIKYLKSCNNSGQGQCDVYSDRINILDLLITSNCTYIPSIQQLSKMDSIRRVRDWLIGEERWSVAMEISTKCGLDSTGVWSAWGLSCLRIGDYKDAREKFAKCLKPLKDKSGSPSNQKLLMEIVDTIHTSPSPGSNILAPLKSIKDLLEPPIQQQKTGTGSLADDPRMQERLYYLTTYGSHINITQFYVKNGMIRNALAYILDYACLAESFVEGILTPALNSGTIGRVHEQMSHLDPTLNRWSGHLTAVCRHFSRHKNYNTLYHVQIFMKDFIRAAMTCITCFYQQGATNYTDLYSRLIHLYNGKTHLESYLDEHQWGSVSRPHLPRQPSWDKSPAGGTTRMVMTPGEVTKYIHTVDLQIEVTKFLYRYHENLEEYFKSNTSSGISPSHQPSQSPGAGAQGFGTQGAGVHSRRGSVTPRSTDPYVPTLFGSTRMKGEVACLVLQCGNNVHDGFGLAFRVILDFKLDSTFIYTQVGRFFAKRHRYNYIRQLLSNIQELGLVTDQHYDEVVGACVRVIADEKSQSREAESLIKLIRLETNRINSYLLCGKLRSAYLTAVQGGRVHDVRRIAAAADRAGQDAVKSICHRWLKGKGESLDGQ